MSQKTEIEMAPGRMILSWESGIFFVDFLNKYLFSQIFICK